MMLGPTERLRLRVVWVPYTVGEWRSVGFRTSFSIHVRWREWDDS